MSTQLYRYIERPNPRRLTELLASPQIMATEPMGHPVDLDEFDEAAESALSLPERSKADAVMAVTLHRALMGRVSRRDAADMRLWHWMCIALRPQYVWRRWHGTVPDDPATAMSTKLRSRFLGAATLRGVSRNNLARLWWCAEALYSPEHQYRLVEDALRKQDLFQAVFERRFGLHTLTAQLFIEAFVDKSEREWRSAGKRLDYRLSTVTLEALGDEAVRTLMASLL